MSRRTIAVNRLDLTGPKGIRIKLRVSEPVHVTLHGAGLTLIVNYDLTTLKIRAQRAGDSLCYALNPAFWPVDGKEAWGAVLKLRDLKEASANARAAVMTKAPKTQRLENCRSNET